jgi:DNA ligase 1
MNMFVSPMLLQYAKDNKPFNDDNCITELKLDGIRLLPSNTNRPRLYTRHNNEITANYPELIEAMPIPDGTIIDSELIVSDEFGKPDFYAAMERFRSTKSKHKAHVVAFDIIKYKHKDVTSLPLLERKKILEEAFTPNEYYCKSMYLIGKGIEYFNAVKQQGLEGVVIKQANSKYEIGKKTGKWQKVIAYEMGEFYIAGYKKDKFGWLISDGMKIVGNMEFGTSADDRTAGYSKFKQLKTGETKDTVYLDPILKCVVKHRGYTRNGMLRLPIFEHFIR